MYLFAREVLAYDSSMSTLERLIIKETYAMGEMSLIPKRLSQTV